MFWCARSRSAGGVRREEWRGSCVLDGQGLGQD